LVNSPHRASVDFSQLTKAPRLPLHRGGLVLATCAASKRASLPENSACPCFISLEKVKSGRNGLLSSLTQYVHFFEASPVRIATDRKAMSCVSVYGVAYCFLTDVLGSVRNKYPEIQF
jgi:hypothetical protein